MISHFHDYGAGFTLGEEKESKHSNEELEDIIHEEFPEHHAVINVNNEIEFFDYYFVGKNLEKGFKQLEEFLEDLPIKGAYFVPELNLKDATFKEVLEAVRSYYLQKLSTHKKRTAKV